MDTQTIKSNQTKVHKDCKRLVASDFSVKRVNFIASDEWANMNKKHVEYPPIKRRVFMADVSGLDWPEHSHCHVLLDLYYETHKAMSIPFATKKDAWKYVDSQGDIDHRIISKTALFGNKGWKLGLKA